MCPTSHMYTGVHPPGVPCITLLASLGPLRVRVERGTCPGCPSALPGLPGRSSGRAEPRPARLGPRPRLRQRRSAAAPRSPRSGRALTQLSREHTPRQAPIVLLPLPAPGSRSRLPAPGPLLRRCCRPGSALTGNSGRPLPLRLPWGGPYGGGGESEGGSEPLPTEGSLSRAPPSSFHSLLHPSPFHPPSSPPVTVVGTPPSAWGRAGVGVWDMARTGVDGQEPCLGYKQPAGRAHGVWDGKDL